MLLNGIFRCLSFFDMDDIFVLDRIRFGLTSPGAAYPDVAFTDGTDCSGLHKFNNATIIVTSVDLSSHLSRHASCHGCFANHACFVHVIRQRFFAVDMLAEFQGWQRGKCVSVFARADNDGVEFIGVII